MRDCRDERGRPWHAAAPELHDLAGPTGCAGLPARRDKISFGIGSPDQARGWCGLSTIRSYEFLTIWRVAGTVQEVMAVLDDVESLPVWWPSVYVSVTQVAGGGADGIGRRIRLHTTGWLPYSLYWESTLIEPVTERGFALTARGDLSGTGRWTFQQDGPEVVLTFDWRITADKPILRRLSWLFKPIFAANHRWAMARGEESMRLELRRRRATAATAAGIPSPPGPTFRLFLST
jgi:hypothetical protein